MTRPSVPESDLQQAQSVSHEAFEQIVRAHQRSVRVFVARHVPDLHTADEIAQDVFLAAHRNLAQYGGRGSVGAWLMGIARNQVLTWLRRQRGRSEFTLDERLDSIAMQSVLSDSFDEEAEARRIDALKSCLQSLDELGRDLIVRFYYQSETAEHIGTQLGKAPGTIRMALLRIRRRLRMCIDGRLSGTGKLS